MGEQRLGPGEAEDLARGGDQRIVVGADEAPGEEQRRDRSEGGTRLQRGARQRNVTAAFGASV